MRRVAARCGWPVSLPASGLRTPFTSALTRPSSTDDPLGLRARARSVHDVPRLRSSLGFATAVVLNLGIADFGSCLGPIGSVSDRCADDQNRSAVRSIVAPQRDHLVGWALDGKAPGSDLAGEVLATR
jgi:hypothetical protein